MDNCAFCNVALVGNVVELHPICAKKLAYLYGTVKKLADAGEKEWAISADELWPEIKNILYGNSTERIFKITLEPDGKQNFIDVTDEYNQLWSILRQAMQEEQEQMEEDEDEEELEESEESEEDEEEDEDGGNNPPGASGRFRVR